MPGAPLPTVQELLGHSTIQMTMRDTHLSPEAQRDVVQGLCSSNSTIAAQKKRRVEKLVVFIGKKWCRRRDSNPSERNNNPSTMTRPWPVLFNNIQLLILPCRPMTFRLVPLLGGSLQHAYSTRASMQPYNFQKGQWPCFQTKVLLCQDPSPSRRINVPWVPVLYGARQLECFLPLRGIRIR